MKEDEQLFLDALCKSCVSFGKIKRNLLAVLLYLLVDELKTFSARAVAEYVYSEIEL